MDRLTKIVGANMTKTMKSLWLWGVDGSGKIWYSHHQVDLHTTGSPYQWSAWHPFRPETGGGVPAHPISMVTAIPLGSGGWIQLWAIDAKGELWTTWQTTHNDNVAWVPWQKFGLPNQPTAKAKMMAAVGISGSGDPQFFLVESTGKIYTCWRTAGSWSGWQGFDLPDTSPSITSITAAETPHGLNPINSLAYVFVTDERCNIWWRRKGEGILSGWTPWSKLELAHQPTAKMVSAAPIAGGVSLLSVGNNGALSRLVITTRDPSDSWRWESVSSRPPGSGDITIELVSPPRPWEPSVNLAGSGDVASKFTSQNNPVPNRVWAIDTLDGLPQIWTCHTTFNQDWALFLKMQRQQQHLWCWAAATATISEFYDINSKYRNQCTVVGYILRNPQCCPYPSECNRTHDLKIPLQYTGNLAMDEKGAKPLGVLLAQINNKGRPVATVIYWKKGGSHVAVISGAGTNNMLTIDDPWYGQTYISYDTFRASYQGSGTWGWTYLTQPATPTQEQENSNAATH